MKQNMLYGVVVPIVTPLTANREIDQQGTSRLIDFLIDGGVHGIFALGSTGEFVSLPWPQQRCFLAAVSGAIGDRAPLCAGVTSNCIEETIGRAHEAAAAGVGFAVVLPPFYFRVSQSELIRYFTEIADRSPIPVVMYNMPFRTNNNIEPTTVEALAAHPNIAGLKDTVSDMVRTLDVLGRIGKLDDFAYLHGNELLALPAIVYGARGLVPSIANFDPARTVAAYEAAVARDMDAIQQHQAHIQSLMRVFGLLEARPQDSTTLRLQAIKAVLCEMGICEPHMAQLSDSIAPDKVDAIRKFMISVGLCYGRA